MADFSELVRNFDKIRDYMRDFYIYGFKTREDFTAKSLRTYDNEKRRIESYLGPYIRWSYDQGAKRTFVALDTSQVAVNPLYAAWKSKSFTSTDIMLHFYILDVLRGDTPLSVAQITDKICAQSGRLFDPQTVRLKCKEYQEKGMLCVHKQGRTLLYSLSQCQIPDGLWDAVRFFQGAAPLGVIGSFMLDGSAKSNRTFLFKHNFVVHTLEDGVLLPLLQAIRQQRQVAIVCQTRRGPRERRLEAIPLKIFVSASTGRRYVCMYHPFSRRLVNHRLDRILSVNLLAPVPDYPLFSAILQNNLDKVWGVSFGNKSRKEIICMKLFIPEDTELYVLHRLQREGRGGEILRLERNIYLYTKEVFDSNEMAPWIKTFTGRILALEGSNRQVVDKFYQDMDRMAQMYGEGSH